MKLKTLNNTQLCPQPQESYNTLPWFNTLDHTRKASFRTREEPGETIQNTVIYSAAKKNPTDTYQPVSNIYPNTLDFTHPQLSGKCVSVYFVSIP